MITVLINACSMIAVIAVGYLLKRVGVLHISDFPTISKLVLWLTLPCAVITNFSAFRPDIYFIWIAVIGLVCNLIMSGCGYFVNRKRSNEDKAFAIINHSGFNIGAFALAYIQTFLGPAEVIAVCVFDAGNSIMCAGATYSLAAGIKDREKFSFLVFIKRTLSSVPVLAYVTMFILSSLQIHLPEMVLSFASVAGRANPFLGMIGLGIAFEIRITKKQIKQLGQMLLLRYSVASILALIFFFCLPFSLGIRQGLVLVAFAPVSSICTVFTDKIKGNVSLAGTMGSASIAISATIMMLLMIWMKSGIIS